MAAPAVYSPADYAAFAAFATGVLCALAIRRMPSGSRRAWLKLAAFELIGVSAVCSGISNLRTVSARTVSPVTVAGTIENLHEASTGPRSSPTLRFNVFESDKSVSPELHADDALLFMNAENGEQVQATYTNETGYVSHLRITQGRSAGYEFDEPDRRNTLPAYCFILFGVVLAVVGICQWMVDRSVDSAL